MTPGLAALRVGFLAALGLSTASLTPDAIVNGTRRSGGEQAAALLLADQAIAGFVDAHVHLNDVTMQLEVMQRSGIQRAVVFWGRDSDNESILAAAREHPDRFIPFVSVSPERRAYRSLWERDDPGLLDTLENYLKSGAFRGIGEISVTHFARAGFPAADWSPLSKSMRGIMRLAAKYRLPVTVHCEVTRIREFAALLREFATVPVIWAHGGYTSNDVARLMLEAHPNLYYELSARTWLSHPRSPDYTILQVSGEVPPEWLELIESHPDRFLVGTDASHGSVEREHRKAESVTQFLMQLTVDTRALVSAGNLLRLVGGT